MHNTPGFLSKLLLFILVVTLPVAILAIWMVSHDILSLEYGLLLTLTPVGPAVLLYNRLLKEIAALTRKMGYAVVNPLDANDPSNTDRGGLLPVTDFLLTMQQYRRVLTKSLKDAEESQKDAALLFNILPNSVLVLDHRRRVVQFNNAATVFFGRTNMEGDLTTYLRNPSLIKAVDATLAGEITGRRVEFEMVGEVSRHIAANVVAFDSGKSEKLRVIITLHDLTAIRKTEQMRVDFIANASHELRTPLAILIGAIETLLGPAANDPKAHKRFLEIMQAQSTRMSQLIDDLLSLSHIEMNEHSRPSDEVNLGDVLNSVESLLAAKAVDLQKQLALEIPEHPVVVAGDKDQLSQVFTNLIDNALKYSRDNSTVTVRLKDMGKEARVLIIDQGEGIPSEHLPRLTERFYRVDSDRSREMGGTGLGLAIVKHIVSRHRGQLDVDSVVGKGSVFSVTLPLNQAKNSGSSTLSEL
ncbi:ATP-binding protein [Sneathiella glossodoripedis]|uniref:ATP-binding protein n=1 Tax=Sneathiella glossodoripedis TaxID=418853 RepID=UPI0004728E0F|nr:ATP-binding protein [Sneathiella glossodoripedis]